MATKTIINQRELSQGTGPRDIIAEIYKDEETIVLIVGSSIYVIPQKSMDEVLQKYRLPNKKEN
jgi:hypothetical protein